MALPSASTFITLEDEEHRRRCAGARIGLNNVNKFLLVLKHPVLLVIVSSSKIAHHMLVTKENISVTGSYISIREIPAQSLRRRPIDNQYKEIQ
jgi:hypothetical protein